MASTEFKELFGPADLAQFCQPVDGQHRAGAGSLDIDLHTPVGAAGQQHGVGFFGKDLQGLVQIRRPAETAQIPRGGIGALDVGSWWFQDRLSLPGCQGVFGFRCAQCVGGIADRTVPGAAAEIARQRVQVESIRSALVRLAIARADCGLAGALGAVVFGGHGAHESGSAISALGSAAVGHLFLHRVHRRDAAQPFGGDDFLAIKCCGRQQAGVHCRPSAALPVTACHQDGAGAAFALGAAFLASDQSLPAQEIQRVGMRGSVDFLGRSVDGNQAFCLLCCLGAHAADTSCARVSPGAP